MGVVVSRAHDDIMVQREIEGLLNKPSIYKVTNPTYTLTGCKFFEVWNLHNPLKKKTIVCVTSLYHKPLLYYKQSHKPRALGVISCARASTVTLPRPLFDITSGEQVKENIHDAHSSQTTASFSPLQCSFNCSLHPHSLSLVRSSSFNLEMEMHGRWLAWGRG